MSSTASTPSAPKSRRHLDQVRIASPCSERWEAMQGDDRTRFCAGCEKHVHNLSAMTTAEADALLARTKFGICVRYYQRADGTVMTSDCAVGVTRKRKVRVLAAASMWFSALATALGCAPSESAHVADAGASDAEPVAPIAPEEVTHALLGEPLAPVLHADAGAPPPAATLGKMARPFKRPVATMGAPVRPISSDSDQKAKSPREVMGDIAPAPEPDADHED